MSWASAARSRPKSSSSSRYRCSKRSWSSPDISLRRYRRKRSASASGSVGLSSVVSGRARIRHPQAALLAPRAVLGALQAYAHARLQPFADAKRAPPQRGRGKAQALGETLSHIDPAAVVLAVVFQDQLPIVVGQGFQAALQASP